MGNQRSVLLRGIPLLVLTVHDTEKEVALKGAISFLVSMGTFLTQS